MKLKIFFVAAATLVLFSNIKAQNAQLKAGVNLANVSTTDDGSIDDANMLTSFHVGILAPGNLGACVVTTREDSDASMARLVVGRRGAAGRDGSSGDGAR